MLRTIYNKFGQPVIDANAIKVVDDSKLMMVKTMDIVSPDISIRARCQKRKTKFTDHEIVQVQDTTLSIPESGMMNNVTNEKQNSSPKGRELVLSKKSLVSSAIRFNVDKINVDLE